MINWHRLFGVALMDLFTDTGYTVEVEKDLSLKQQFLDVIIVETSGPTYLTDLPDGLDNLDQHNLLTYKSLHESLDAWALDELIGHYVNYRKQISPGMDRLLPVEAFRLYAVATRMPQNLQQGYMLSRKQAGVYDIEWGSQVIRIIVLSDIPPTPNNALWELFSAVPQQVRYGAAHYHWRDTAWTTVTKQLYQYYQLEGINMSYTIEDFRRDYYTEHKDEILQYLSPEDRLKGLSPDEILRRLSPDEILRQFSLDDLLQQVPPEQIEAYLKKVREQHATN